MVTAPLLTVGVDVDLPTNDGDDLPDSEFYVSSDGSVYLRTKTALEKVAPQWAVFDNPELTVYRATVASITVVMDSWRP